MAKDALPDRDLSQTMLFVFTYSEAQKRTKQNPLLPVYLQHVKRYCKCANEQMEIQHCSTRLFSNNSNL